MNETMTKTITLDRKINLLHIKDEGAHGTVFFGVTHVKHLGHGWWDIYCDKRLLGFVMGVKTVKEKW